MNEEENERIERYNRISTEINKLQKTLLRIHFEKIRIERESKEVHLRLRNVQNYRINDPMANGLLDEVDQDDNKIIIGVEVRITNPHIKQLDQGIVKGFTSNGFAQIYTSDGTFIKRHLKNLRRVNRYQGRNYWDTLSRNEDDEWPITIT